MSRVRRRVESSNTLARPVVPSLVDTACCLCHDLYNKYKVTYNTSLVTYKKVMDLDGAIGRRRRRDCPFEPTTCDGGKSHIRPSLDVERCEYDSFHIRKSVRAHFESEATEDRREVKGSKCGQFVLPDGTI